MALLVAVILSLLFSLGTYRGFKPTGLVALRFMGSLLLLLFVMGYSIKMPRREKPEVWLYRDVSPSMKAGKWAWADTVFSKLKSVAAREYYFSDSIYTSEVDTPVGNYTDLSLPVKETGGDLCVIVTDGLHNAPQNPYETARERGIPILFVLPPESGIGSDVEISDVAAPSVVRVGERADVVVSYRLSGIDSSALTLSLEEDTNVVFDTTFVAAEGKHDLTLSIYPAKIGFHTYKLKFDRIAGEEDTLNNAREIGLEVVKGKSIGVLLATHPTPDIRLIRDIVSNATYASIDVFVQTSNGKWKLMGSSVADTIPPDSSDFLVLIDPDDGIFKMVQRVSPSKIVIVPGRNSVKSRVMGFKYARNGKLSPGNNWNEINSDFSDWSDLPELRVISGGHPSKVFLQAGQLPAVYLDVSGSAVIAVEDFWIDGLYRPKLYRDIWNYILTTVSHPGNIFLVHADPPLVYRGQFTRIIAGAFDGFGNPLDGLDVVAVVDSDTLTLAYAGGGNYLSAPVSLNPGIHEIKALFYRDTTMIGSRKGTIKVVDTPVEMLKTGVDTLLPSSIARVSNGMVCHSADECIDFVNKYRITRTFSFTFNRSIFVLLLALGAFMLEWWLRKERGMP